MIRDDNGDEFLYWPFTLEAGQNSQVLVIRVDTPAPGQVLGSPADSRAQVFARPVGGGAYTNLATAPIDLTALAGPYTRFEVYVHALGVVTTFERVSLFVGARSSSPAGWTA